MINLRTAQFVKLDTNARMAFLIIAEINTNQVMGKILASLVLLEKIAILVSVQIVQLDTTVNLATTNNSVVPILSQT